MAGSPRKETACALWSYSAVKEVPGMAIVGDKMVIMDSLYLM